MSFCSSGVAIPESVIFRLVRDSGALASRYYHLVRFERKKMVKQKTKSVLSYTVLVL